MDHVYVGIAVERSFRARKSITMPTLLYLIIWINSIDVKVVAVS